MKMRYKKAKICNKDANEKPERVREEHLLYRKKVRRLSGQRVCPSVRVVGFSVGSGFVVVVVLVQV